MTNVTLACRAAFLMFEAWGGTWRCVRGYSLYLLRHADNRAKGLGFALAGNFYPDFLLWLVDVETGKQWLSFIDPKGIRNLNISDPKFGLYKEIKQIEKQLGDGMIRLSSFILSFTTLNDLLNVMEHPQNRT